ncbi:MAG: peptide ABC transporter substrate-binding protein [Opitutaceae bacterium]|nr:peptide ABC transporter substrate-binding protein [Opitutaceae bacterium]
MRVRLAIPILLAGLFMAACGRRELPATAGVRTQTLLLGNGAEPADLDPHVVTAYSDQNVLMALFEGLTVLDEQTSQPVAAAAERWEASADRLTWTFHLRPGLKWSDGTPLAAADFVQSWRRLLTPAIGAENAYYLYPIKNAEAFNKGQVTDAMSIGVSAPDDRTVVVNLTRPTPYFPMLVAQPSTYPVNLRVLDKFGAVAKRGTHWTRPGNLVGNGPFALKEWLPNARIVVAHNPNYWNAANTKLRGITFYPTESPDVDERNFRAGQIHATFTLPLAKVAAWRREGGKTAADNPLRLDPFLQTVFLRFNTTRDPLNDPRVRRALSMALDRESIAKNVLRGSRAAAVRLTPPGIGGFMGSVQVPHDIATARQLLADAGHAGGAGLPVFELQCRNDELQPEVAEVLQAMWQRELGVRVNVARLEQKTWLQNQQTLAYAITFGSWVADFPDASNFLGLFVADGGYNWTGWTDAKYDELLGEADKAVETTARHALFDQAEKRLLDGMPIAPLFHGAQTYLLHSAVKGWPPSLLGTRRYQLVHLEH